MERILLELYCQYDPSLSFRELVAADCADYYQKIKRPISLDMIRTKLSPSCESGYKSVSEVIADIRQVFKNAYEYNDKDSQVYSDAKSLEEFLDQMLEKWLPDYAYDEGLRVSADDGDADYIAQSDDESSQPAKKYRRVTVTEEDDE